MKTNKWLSWTIAILLSVIALGAVGFTTFRMGYMQGAVAMQKVVQSQTTKDGKPTAQNPGPSFGPMNFHGEFDRMHGFGDGRGFRNERGVGGRPGFFPSVFGLFHFAVLILLIWIGYVLFKKSGWQFVRVPASQPAVEAKAEKKKE